MLKTIIEKAKNNALVLVLLMGVTGVSSGLVIQKNNEVKALRVEVTKLRETIEKIKTDKKKAKEARRKAKEKSWNEALEQLRKVEASKNDWRVKLW
jgi:regulator of replication initiation timing